MATTLTGNGVTYTDGSDSSDAPPIIKYRVTAGSSVDQGLQSGDWDYINNCEIDMGVPKASNNWYRIEYYTCTDDQGSTNGGCGYAVYRHTPSAGWQRVLDQGWHAQYENNLGDFYTNNTGLYYVPVHPSYPTENHTFRLYGRRHPDCAWRVNASIGADNRVGGWQNNLMEVYEMNGNVISIQDATTY